MTPAAIKAARLKRGLSQTQLASALGVSQPMIAEIESGVRLIPKELRPMLRKWMSTGQLPSAEDLAKRKEDRAGK